MSGIKGGKKPLSQKAPSVESFGDFGNKLTIPVDVKKDAEEKGIHLHWVNSKKLYENQGYHDKGWQVYRRNAPSIDMQDFKLGNDPAGVIRRGDLILAFKTSEEYGKHQSYLKYRRDAQKDPIKRKADELRQMARGAGLPVIEGYDENNE